MTTATPVPLLDDSGVTDEDRRRDLRRMKAFAGGLLVLAAVVFVVAKRAEAAGAGAWVGYVVTAAEAGMVGGLADWFAVTALFRHPLGLPIPHTAIVPNRKDQLGRNLGDFVGTHFLAEEVVRGRVRSADISGRVGAWLTEKANAERVVGEAATALRGTLAVLRDEDVQDLLEQTVVRPLAKLPVGPPLGRVLDRVVLDGSHRGLVDLVVGEAAAWLRANRRAVVDVIARQAPTWSPRLVDEIVAYRVYLEIVRFVDEVGERQDHSARQAFDRYLATLAVDLRTKPETMAQADALWDRLLDHAEVRRAIGEIWSSVRRVLLEAIEDPASELRRRAVVGLQSLGARLGEDSDLRAKTNGWIEDVVAHVATTYRSELTTVITDTIERWGPEETTRRIELRVGRDLQFIRVNGTVVGALAGLVIHAVGTLLG